MNCDDRNPAARPCSKRCRFDRLTSRARHLGLALAIASAACGVAIFPSIVAAQTTAGLPYESVGRILVIHERVVEEAAPVSMETAAATHAALIPSARFVEYVLKPHATQLRSIRPAGTITQWAEAVSRNVTVVAKPSVDSSRGCVIEYRCRSVNLGEAAIVAYMMGTAYEGFLNATESLDDDKRKQIETLRSERTRLTFDPAGRDDTVEAASIKKRLDEVRAELKPLEAAAMESNIRQATTIRDDLTRTRDELLRPGNPGELARAEHRLREAQAELQRLQLKARYGYYQVVVLQYPKQATRVSGP